MPNIISASNALCADQGRVRVGAKAMKARSMNAITSAQRDIQAAAKDFVVGQTCAYHQLVDDALVRGYADLTGDHNKIHVDDDFARKTRFGQRIAHGGILFGMVSKAPGG
jgi:acyl dehydratase